MTHDSALYLGIDFGTSGCRAIAIDAQGTIAGTVKLNYPSQSIQSAPYHEQQAEMWWHSLIHVITELGNTVELQNIQRIAIDGTSATLLLVDANGSAKSPALMYNDARSIS